MSEAFIPAAAGQGDAERHDFQAHDMLGAATLRSRRGMLLLPLIALLVLLVLAYGGYALNWTWTGFKGNTLWDWINLLITPVTIGTASILFTLYQGRRSLTLSERQHEEVVLDAYLDHITHLLVDNNLREAPDGSTVREVARARTLATLQRVSDDRRAFVVRFLDESGLIHCERPVIDPRDIGVGSDAARPQA